MTERKIENVRIAAAERRNNSNAGNPRWRLSTDHGTFDTETDGQIGYTVSNLANSRRPDFAIGDDAPPVTLVLRGSRVIRIERNATVLR